MPAVASYPILPCILHVRYKDLATEQAAAAAASTEEAEGSPQSGDEAGDIAREGGEGDDAEEGADAAGGGDVPEARGAPMGLPISVVKRIMTCDEDVSRVSNGAIRATARAAELFMQVSRSPIHGHCGCRLSRP